MKKEFLKFFVLLVIAIGAGPATGSFWQWSMTPSANGNSDPSINWIEGMPPSAVNDSARAMMARLAEQAADTSGSLIATGGPTAFAVTTNQGLAATPNNGQVLGVVFPVNSSGNPTLAVDGGSVVGIVSTPGVGANLTAAVPYTMVYLASTGNWYVRGGAGGGIPLGAIIPYTGSGAAPPNYVYANGQCISTTTYAVYWAVMGSPGPGVCGAGLFQVFDARGFVLAGLDTMPGSSAAGRLTAAATGCGVAMISVGVVCTNGHESHVQAVAELARHYHYAPMYDPGHSHTINSGAGIVVLGYQASAGLDHALGGSVNWLSITIDSHTTGVHVQSSVHGNDYTEDQGSSQAMPMVQPTIGLNYIIRVL